MDEIMSLSFALIAIFAILYLSYLSAKYLSIKTSFSNNTKYIKVIDRAVLAQDKYLAIVNIQSEFYLVSISSNNINLITKLENFNETDTCIKTEDTQFNTILNKFIKNKKEDSDD